MYSSEKDVKGDYLVHSTQMVTAGVVWRQMRRTGWG